MRERVAEVVRYCTSKIALQDGGRWKSVQKTASKVEVHTAAKSYNYSDTTVRLTSYCIMDGGCSVWTDQCRYSHLAKRQSLRLPTFPEMQTDKNKYFSKTPNSLPPSDGRRHSKGSDDIWLRWYMHNPLHCDRYLLSYI